MKSTVSGIPAAAFMLAWCCHERAAAATTMVDWLDLTNVTSSSSFALTSDRGQEVAQGGIAVEPGKGILFRGFPTLTELSTGFWSGETGYLDSVTGNDRVRTFDIRVAPTSGMVSYAINLNVPAGKEFIIAVGGLYHDSEGATKSIVTTTSGGGVISYVKALAWNANAGTKFTQELEWDGDSGTLSTTIGSVGDSEVAFLRVSPLSGPNPQLVFTVPEGYGKGSGESISIGVGMVVPEPGVFVLAGMGALIGLVGRRR